MCSIVGLKKKENFDLVKLGFDRSSMRGPDDTRYIEVNDSLLGFKRLAIMGLDESGMQPFTSKGSAVVCNGEIFGFRKLKEMLKNEYNFVSESDCEVLLPLYNDFGFSMFKMLDAEFALIIYDEKLDTIIAARDPFGIRPLYYGTSKVTNEIMFASEPKIIIDLVDEIFPFPPGHYYDGKSFVKFCDYTTKTSFKKQSIDEVTNNIHDKLVAGIVKRLDSDAPLGYLLSGGLDSSLVCAVAQKYMDKPIKTFAIGMDFDPIDLKYARTVAEYIGSDHTEVSITKKDVLDCVEEIIEILGTYDITTIRASIGMYLICKYIHKNTDIRVLLTGEISDELFGYKYTDFAPNAEEFQKEAKKRIDEIHMYDVLRADRSIASNSLEARVPFGDIDFVDYVMGIDPAMKLNTYGQGKYLLRKAFSGKGLLPDSILYREKAAFSDAVGHSLVDYLKEEANNKYTDAQFEELSSKYTHAKPFTKESLMYREIFEKYYKGQSKMVSDFWMPNKTWENCDVDDPSARVLKNYGDSSK